jgi:signal transduction histidine kinase
MPFSVCAKDTMMVSGEVYHSINEYFTYLDATSQNQSIEDAVEALAEGKFSKWKNAPFHTGHGNVTYWFHLVLKNSNRKAQTYLWSFYKNSNYINLYQKNSGGMYELKYQNSVHLPLSKRPYNGKALSFPFELQADEAVDLLVQINKTSTESPYLDHDIKEIKQWLRYDIKATTIITSFFSIFLLTSLFNLLLFFVFREKIYLGQWLLIFSFSLYTIHLYGVDVYLLPEKIYNYWSHVPLLIPVAVSYILLIALFRRFVDLAHHNSKLDKVFSWIYLIAVIGLIQFLFIHYSVNLFSSNAENYSALLKISRLLCVVNNWSITALLLYGSACYFYKGNGEIKIYSASMFVFMCSILLFLFIRYQTNTDTQLILHISILLTFTFHIVILALLTINRFFKKHTENIALLRERNFIQEKLTTDIIKAQESERKRIAQELHDGVNGNMAALRLYINRQMHLFQDKLKNIELNNSFVIMQNQADDIINQIRSLSHRLLPKDFEDHVFSELVKSHIEQLNDSTNIQWTVIVDEEVNNISKDIQINLYRILMELCRNIIAHSKANTATIQLLYYPDNVQLLVEDNGIGFNPNAVVDGIGLKNIRSRVDFFKGNFNIESNKFATTTIIEIPLTHEQ